MLVVDTPGIAGGVAIRRGDAWDATWYAVDGTPGVLRDSTIAAIEEASGMKAITLDEAAARPWK